MADLLNAADVQDMLGVTGDADLAILQTYISTASEKIAAMCGPVIREEGQDGFPITEYFDGDGTATVRVLRPPIYEVAALSERIGQTWDLADTWVVYPGGRVVRRDSDNTYDRPFAVGRQNVSVGYYPGRYPDVTAVPERFRTACFMIVDRLWRLYQATGTSTYGTDGWVPAKAVPPMVNELLVDELLPPPFA